MKKFLLLFGALLVCQTGRAQVNNGTYTADEETYKLLKSLSDSRLKNGEIYLFTTTHQDLGWLDDIESCIVTRDTLWLTPFLQRLEKEPDFKMDIEQTSILMEYIERYPEKKELIEKYLREGRICVGATYIQPYEEMYSGESLARQFYFGNRWLKKNFSGYKALSYFNVDVPGRTLQMPQIMQKAGVDNLIISRHERGLFNWEAPDGSKVRTYTPGHYMYFYTVLGMNDTAAVKELAKESVLWYTQYNDIPKSKTVMPAMLNYEFIWDQKPVENTVPFITKWNSIQYIQREQGKKVKVNLPKFRYAIADEFFNTLDKSTSSLPTIKGERPDVWLYIHGPSHEQAITASRKGDVWLPAAEKASSFLALVNQNFNAYPEGRLQHAWKAKIYPDHGWGGNGGVMTDNTFLRKYEYALSETTAILDENLSTLASHIQTEPGNGRPIIVFNTMSREREGVVSVDVRFEPGYAHSIAVFKEGTKAASQLSDVISYPDQSIRSAKLHFVASAVPSLGYTTYYLHPDNSEDRIPAQVSTATIETPFYRIDLQAGGIKQITDKELNVRLLDTSKFLGGEVITMQSVGNGAGEFDAVQQPTMEGFDKTSNYKPEWKLVEQGDVYTSFTYRSRIRHAVVEQTMRVYHTIKKIDFDVAILNWEGILYREFRMMLPLDLTNAEVTYEVPYGILTVGKDEMPGAAGERYLVENQKQHPRGIVNWIAASGDSYTVTLSSSVAVADYIDPTSDPSAKTMLQPILLASRKSCHWLGNEYLQKGNHYYHFSLSSHAKDPKTSMHFGTSANESLQAVYNPRTYREAALPATLSFVKINNQNAVISALKKCEDDNSLIIRLYNPYGNREALEPEFFRKPVQIIRTNLIEEEIEPVDQMVLDPYAIETYKLRFE